VTYEPGAPLYTGDDLRADVVGLLDALGLTSAHVVGISMGGAMAQLVTLDFPDRVASLTLISTTAGAGDPDLPGATEEVRAVFADPPPEPEWSDRAAVIDYIVEGDRPFEARSRPFDEARARDRAERVVDRAINIESGLKNHWLLGGGGESWRERLAELRAPTLVVHGAEDPLFPLEHGRALAREIPNADLLILEGTGHEVPPPPTWDLVIPAILKHTARH
jgi:pimeloyl-ACP methyl ester carboxylesterase